MFKSHEALGLSFVSFHQKMIETEKSKIATWKYKSGIARANNLPPGNGNTNFITGIFLQHIFWISTFNSFQHSEKYFRQVYYCTGDLFLWVQTGIDINMFSLSLMWFGDAIVAFDVWINYESMSFALEKLVNPSEVGVPVPASSLCPIPTYTILQQVDALSQFDQGIHSQFNNFQLAREL